MKAFKSLRPDVRYLVTTDRFSNVPAWWDDHRHLWVVDSTGDRPTFFYPEEVVTYAPSPRPWSFLRFVLLFLVGILILVAYFSLAGLSSLVAFWGCVGYVLAWGLSFLR